MIWTNDFALRDSLMHFNCKTNCRVGGRGHHEYVTKNISVFDYSVIPQPLAEEVASYVDAKFVLDRIRRTPAAPPG